MLYRLISPLGPKIARNDTLVLAAAFPDTVALSARCLATFLIVLSLILPAMSVELFRYRGANAADFMTTFYHVQIGALETQEFRTQPLPFWLIYFSDTTKGPMRQMFFVVLLPDGTVVEPRVEKRL
jgi:hypothetical protein